ncbi:hypothetical protein D3C83_50240 [compost metagenome]
MYLVNLPAWNSLLNTLSTSSPFQTSVTFWRFGFFAIFSSAARPMNSWSKRMNPP